MNEEQGDKQKTSGMEVGSRQKKGRRQKRKWEQTKKGNEKWKCRKTRESMEQWKT